MPQLSPTLNIMMRAAEKAARSLVRDFGEVEHLQVSQKGPGDFVSAADRRAEEIIHNELQKAQPGYGFLMEESGEIKGADSAHRWIIDPLDGTTNFLHGLPHWCISIALERDGEIVAGLIHDPVKDEIFHAEKGKGAFSGRHRLRVSARKDLMLATVSVGAPCPRNKTTITQFMKEYQAVLEVVPSLRRFGAAALDLAHLAAGRYEAFWHRGLKSWDVAAGYLMVKEAGGFVCELDSEKKNPVDTGNILAANAELFNEMKKTLRSI